MKYLKQLGLSFALAAIFSTPRALAHEGHDHTPGDDPTTASGPIVISAGAKQNLGLLVKEAETRSIESVLKVIGQVEQIPSKSVAITSRISGRVSSLFVLEGESVKKGQALVEVESRQLGDPPPKVDYRSPIDGVVIDRHAVLGDTVEPDKHLLEVADLSEVYIEGRIYEGQVAQVQSGQKARIQVESFPDDLFEGKVEVISGALDPESRTLKVWVRVQNPSLKLRPNMRASLSLLIGANEPVIAVLNQAILGEAGDYFAFIQSESNPLQYQRQSVIIGAKDDLYTEIIEGILPGDKVVTAGNYQLQYVKAQTKDKASSNTDATLSTSSEQSRVHFVLWLALFASLALNLILGAKLKRKLNSEER